jgi:hypothetical protein
MDYGGSDRRTTKKDMKRKKAVYKKGGKFRTREINNLDKNSELKK